MIKRPLAFTVSHPRLSVDERHVRRAIRVLDAYHRHKIPEGALSIAYVTDRTIAQIHADFMDDPTPTDVITFPGFPPEDAGEICMSVDYAIRAARRFRTSPLHELNLYLVHGFLHLAGFDDRSPAPKRLMRLAERELMGELTRKNVLIPFKLK